jgi:hypothetical protein
MLNFIVFYRTEVDENEIKKLSENPEVITLGLSENPEVITLGLSENPDDMDLIDEFLLDNLMIPMSMTFIGAEKAEKLAFIYSGNYINSVDKFILQI